jgi:iron-sulfur cluster assembly protein
MNVLCSSAQENAQLFTSNELRIKIIKPHICDRKGLCMPAVITLQPAVVTYVRDKIAHTATLAPEAQIIGLWVEVTKKGCSGNAYAFDVMTAAKLASFQGLGRFEQPERVEQDGVTVFLEPQSVMKVIGSELYLEQDSFSTRLAFRNPNAQDFCGCGESFTVTPPV